VLIKVASPFPGQAIIVESGLFNLILSLSTIILLLKELKLVLPKTPIPTFYQLACSIIMSDKRNFLVWCIVVVMLYSCNNKFTNTLFKGRSPHQQYEQKLVDAGLNGTTLFKQWTSVSRQSILQPISIVVPFLEEAYFTAGNPNAVAYIFDARKGEQLQIKLELHSLDSTQLFIDLFKAIEDTTKEQSAIYSANTRDSTLIYNIQDNGEYLLRIQPELLSNVSYQLQITAEPSLANPVEAGAKQNIGSFFGDGRDAGSRKHEGVDIFAERFTPAVAAADGVIGRVGTNNLGGKIVFLRAADPSVNLYYAHLDSQLVSTGQTVRIGDTIGLIGNTGNAKTTPPHLHFGIYTRQGAVDPLPFIKPGKSNPAKISADTKRIGDTVRTTISNTAININTPIVIEGAVQNSYRVTLPNNDKVIISQNQVSSLTKPLRTIAIDEPKTIYIEPNILSARVLEYPSGSKLEVFGEYNGFYLIKDKTTTGWMRP
jgi:murein DD-endopeptidase MepM/ murein hydrolase activator NlpD